MTHMRTRIFSILLTCAMLLSLLPATALAEEGTECTNPDCSHVAAIGNTHYDTLADAVDAVVSSNDKAGTVTLLKDAQGCGIGLFNNKGHVGIDLTIDFGGHTYTAGDPAVGSVGTESQAFHLEKGNTVTLKNGTITVASDSQKTAMLIQNYCNLTLDNIDLIGNSRTQYIISCNYGDTVLKDVNISGTHGNLVALDLMHWLGTIYADKAPTMSIQNTAENTISGSVDVYCYGTGADSCPSKPIMTITGGTFSSDVSAFVGPDSVVTEQDGKFVVEALTAANAVASIGNTYYKTLADAVAAVEDGGTVTMLKNASGAGIGTFRGDSKYGVKNFTIDFGGFTYTCTGPAVGSNGTESQAFHLEKGAAVTLKNGTVTSTAGSGVWMLVQNYCDLTLVDMTLNGTNIGTNQYTMSNNCGNINITGNTSIIAPQNGFAFDACWAPNNGYPEGAQVTVNTTGDISGKVEFGLWGSMSEDDVKTTLTIKNGTFNGPIVVGSDLVDAAKTNLTITGGTFSTEPAAAYIANGYELTGSGPWTVSPSAGMEADATADSSGNVSASVTGTWTGDESDDDENNVESTNSSIAIDVTTGEENITSTAVNIDSATLDSVKDTSVSTVTITTDVGTLAVNNQAWSAITDNANGSSVTLSMEKKTSNGLVYTLTAEDASGNEVYAKGDAAGSVTVTVDYSGSNPTVYYLGANGPEKVDSTFVGGKLSWTVSHFSDYLIQGDNTVALVTAGGTTTEYNSLDAALTAATGTSGAVVELVKSASITQKVTVSQDLTIKGNGNTITGVANDASVNFEVTGGTFTISNVTLDGFGSSAGTNSGIAVIKVPDNAANTTKVVATDVNVTDFCRSAYDIRSGSFEITGGTIDCNNSGTDHLTKGVMAGYGTNNVTGKITGVTFTNSSSSYADWDSAAIEVYHHADVTVEGCTINNVENGISVDNYYNSASGSATAAVTVTNTNITASNKAVRVYSKSGATDTATVEITGGTLNGGVAIIDGAQKETVSISNATINGDVSNTNGSMGIVDSTIQGTVSSSGTTIVNTTVNGTLTNTTPDADAVALVGGKTYTDLQTAINAANSGDTVTLLKDVTLNGSGKVNNEGLLLINGKDITLNGNGKTITAENVVANADTAAGPSMINIQGGANVTVKNLTINGAGTNNTVTTDNTKHGLNVYGPGTSVTVENVTIKNGNGYAIVANGAQATINGLTTSNNGWGGINVDSKSGVASLTINNANISEANSVKMENGPSGNNDPVVAIQNGTFQYVTKGGEIATPNLTISGGKFATGNGPADAVNVGNYLAPGLALDGNGNVYTPSGDTGHTGGGSSVSGDYLITVDRTTGGKVTVTPSRANKGDTVTITVKPNDGYVLDELNVTAKNGGSVKLTWKDDNKYAFTMPGSQVTVEATFVKEGGQTVDLPFTDVAEGDWYYDAVEYVYENDLMNGTSATTFSPFVTTSRAMILTILARYDGVDTSTGSTWYEAGAVWAIAEGVSDGTNLEANLTREQLVTMLWRYAGSPVVESDLADYPDSASVSDWAVNAMIWAVENGVITGNGAGALNPQGTATRAEVATILMRFIEK